MKYGIRVFAFLVVLFSIIGSIEAQPAPLNGGKYYTYVDYQDFSFATFRNVSFQLVCKNEITNADSNVFISEDKRGEIIKSFAKPYVAGTDAMFNCDATGAVTDYISVSAGASFPNWFGKNAISLIVYGAPEYCATNGGFYNTSFTLTSFNANAIKPLINGVDYETSLNCASSSIVVKYPEMFYPAVVALNNSMGQYTVTGFPGTTPTGPFQVTAYIKRASDPIDAPGVLIPGLQQYTDNNGEFVVTYQNIKDAFNQAPIEGQSFFIYIAGSGLSPRIVIPIPPPPAGLPIIPSANACPGGFVNTNNDNGSVSIPTATLRIGTVYNWSVRARGSSADLRTGSFTANGDTITPAAARDLAPGAYDLLLSQTGACERPPYPFDITSPAPLAFAAVNPITPNGPILCNGGTTSVTARIQGGKPPYTFQVYSGTPPGGSPVGSAQTTSSVVSPALTGLTAGTYYVRASDDPACKSTRTVNSSTFEVAAAPTPVTATVTAAANLVCSGGKTVLTITPGGGTSPYQYSLNGGSLKNITGPFASDSVGVGTYSALVRDANGCQIGPITGTITAFSPLTLSFGNSVTDSIQTAACKGGPLVFTATLGGGTSSQVLTINPSAAISGTGNTRQITITAGGTYTVTLSDATCSAFRPVVRRITMNEPAVALGVTATATNATCRGGIGGFTLNATGGVPGYTYAYSTSSTISAALVTVTGANFTGIAPGAYYGFVKDLNGCVRSTGTTPFTIEQPAAISIVTASVTSQTGGNPTYQLRCVGDNTPITATIAETLLVGSTYTNPNVTVQLRRKTSPTTYVNIGSPQVVNNAGGFFSYASTPLPAGTYQLQVYYNLSSCSSDVQISGDLVIAEPPSALTFVSPTAIANVTCNGGANGSFIIRAQGGVPSAGSYTLQQVAGPVIGTLPLLAQGIDQTITGLRAGSYQFRIVDALACSTAVFPVNINEPQALTVGVQAYQPLLCAGANNAQLTLQATGGTGSANYQLTTINTAPVAGSWTGPTFTSLGPGTYYGWARDANGCVSSSVVQVVSPVAPLAINNLTTTLVDCQGGSNGTLSFSIGGGAAGNLPYAYTVTRTSPTTGVVQTGTAATAATVVAVTGLTKGTYRITANDNNGCTLPSPVDVLIDEKPPLAVVPSQTNVSCFGGSNGSAGVAITGGTAPYTVQWFNALSVQVGGTDFTPGSSTRNGLVAGTYTVRIRDANNCTNNIAQPWLEQTITITEPPLLVLNAATPTLNCNGDVGGITLSGQGGAGGYRYTEGTDAITPPLDANFSTTNTNYAKGAGTYYFWVKDGNGCVAVRTVTLTQPAALAATLQSKQDVLCNGSATGTANITVTGGTAPYSYSVDGNTWQTFTAPLNLTGLAAGSYIVRVRDVNNCTAANANFSITQPPAITLTLNGVPTASQCAVPTGSAAVTATGGVGALTTRWYLFNSPADSVLAATGTSISNASAGTYTVYTTDANNCVRKLLVAIPSVNGPTVSLASTQAPKCSDSADGAVTFNVSGGTSPYTFSWNDGATALNRSDLLGGVQYSLTVRDASGCNSSTIVTLVAPTPIALASLTQTNPSCNGGNDGQIAVTATGGTAPYTYTWTKPDNSTATGATLTALAAGDYTLAVRDGNNCVFMRVVTLVNPPALGVQVLVQRDPACAGVSNGELTVQGQGGTAPYTYNWTTPTGPATGSSLTALGAGAYALTMSDANGCSTVRNFTLTNPQTLVLSGTASNPLCNGTATGRLQLSTTGGTLPYRYTWSGPVDPGNTATGNNLPAGTYTIAVADANGCSVTRNFTLTDPPVLALSLAQRRNLTCNGSTDGTLAFTATGGTAPYAYAWTGPRNPGNVASSSSLVAGTYTLRVTDANGCVVTLGATLTQPAALTVSTKSNISPTCFGGSDGRLAIAIAGGTAPYTVRWNDNATDSTRTGLRAGSFAATVTDAAGCSANFNTTLVSPPQIPLNLAPRNRALCPGQLLAVNATVPGGGTYIYAWVGPGFISTSPSVLINAAGTYVLTVTNAQGCTRSDTLVVGISNTLLRAVYLAATTITQGDTLVAIELSTPVPERVEWRYPARVIRRQEGAYDKFFFPDTGTFALTMRAFLAGCVDSMTKRIRVNPRGGSVVNPGGQVAQSSVRIVEHRTMPNPTDGRFTVYIRLSDAATAYVQVVGVGSISPVFTWRLPASTEHTLPIQLPPLPPGIYVVYINTDGDRSSTKILLY